MNKNRKIFLNKINNDWIEKNISGKDKFSFILFKKITDLFFGCIGFVIFILLYIPVAILIKIDSKGSVLFKQERVGKRGGIFITHKFRTMHQQIGEDEVAWREKDKNNITRFGRFLRVSHLDEIPQAWNILNGEISFIGPRAEWIEFAKIFEKEIPFYKNRYLIKPGLFGWAQINFPASKSVKEAREKFEYDLYYIKNRSILLDLEIILKSAKLFFL